MPLTCSLAGIGDATAGGQFTGDASIPGSNGSNGRAVYHNRTVVPHQFHQLQRLPPQSDCGKELKAALAPTSGYGERAIDLDVGCWMMVIFGHCW